mgnify:CR=1 FL=1
MKASIKNIEENEIPSMRESIKNIEENEIPSIRASIKNIEKKEIPGIKKSIKNIASSVYNIENNELPAIRQQKLININNIKKSNYGLSIFLSILFVHYMDIYRKKYT